MAKSQKLGGVAGKRLASLRSEMSNEPASASEQEHAAWRESVVGRATALFRMVGRKAALDSMPPRESDRLRELLGENVAVSVAVKAN